MREILFRGKTHDGHWIYGTGWTEFLNMFPDRTGKAWLWSDHQWKEIIHGSLGQYTGLKDKNGKMIFEGDVVCGINGSFNGCPCEWGPFSVEYDESEAKFRVPLWGTYENNDKTHWFEGIGNIHDNPELFK